MPIKMDIGNFTPYYRTLSPIRDAALLTPKKTKKTKKTSFKNKGRAGQGNR